MVDANVVDGRHAFSIEKSLIADPVADDSLTLLTTASRLGVGSVVDELHKRGFSLTSRCEPNGLQAIHLAASRGHLDVVKALVRCGVSTAECDGDGRTALHHATLNRRSAIVEFLMGLESAPADVNRGDGRGWNALHYSCHEGFPGVTDLLLRTGVSLSCRTTMSRCTPLHFAAKLGRLSCAKCLVAAGADVDRVDGNGYAPLHYAAKLGQSKLISFLVKSHAFISSTTSRLKSQPLHLAAQEGNSDCIVELVKGGAEVNCQDVDRWTPAHCASCNGHADCVQILVALQADVHCRTAKRQLCPIHLAAEEGHLSCLKYLLSVGADPRCTDTSGSTPLHKASREGKIECVQCLLLVAADSISLKTMKRGRQPLHLAAAYGHLTTIKLLLKEGSDLTVKDSEGRTPVDLAKKNGHDECVSFLTACLTGGVVSTSGMLSGASGISSDDSVARVKAMMSVSEDSDNKYANSSAHGREHAQLPMNRDENLPYVFDERGQPEGGQSEQHDEETLQSAAQGRTVTDVNTPTLRENLAGQVEGYDLQLLENPNKALYPGRVGYAFWKLIPLDNGV